MLKRKLFTSFTTCLYAALLTIASSTANAFFSNDDGWDIPETKGPFWFKNIQLSQLPFCYNYDCNVITTVSLNTDQWQSVVDLFQPLAHSPESEREKIRQAVLAFELISGQQTPAYRDLGKNAVKGIWPGQMDCIDESTNITTYLTLLAERGLLTFHRPTKADHRGFFNGHYGAQMIEIHSGAKWIIDGWWEDNGNKPYIEPRKVWQRGGDPRRSRRSTSRSTSRNTSRKRSNRSTSNSDASAFFRDLFDGNY